MSIVGTAGWAIPGIYKAHFPTEGSQLERYASVLAGVEINSSFYRSHKHQTYERWASTVPAHFRFSAKVPRAITQHHRLRDYGHLVEQFLAEVSGLGRKLGVLLAQLPPSLVFDALAAESFFVDLGRLGVSVACEPRHASWFEPQADALLVQLGVSRVAADPPRALSDGKPGGDTRLAYFRLHGSPKIYYSDYEAPTLNLLASKLRKQDWCIFDNTAAFCALGNALTLKSFMQ